MRILEGLLCIDVLVRGSERTLEGLGRCWSIWKGPVVVGRSWRVFRDPGGLRLVQKDAGGYTMIKWMVLEEGLGASWQNCRARRVSTSLGESGLWGLGSWEGLRESG